jgi:hypothetical protein
MHEELYERKCQRNAKDIRSDKLISIMEREGTKTPL